ncbi:MAG: metal ABC transporter permease [Candidatus Muirbacterium halophilum]|nr:metal ABC transporter permease [Candidatus Muirbacterium halophilum]MCK9476036.1 metal ABC transporter permease [Candidatus Muirbacterium halophilum]
MTELFEFFQYEFIRNAFFTLIILSIPLGIIGTLIVINRLVFSAEGIAHTAFGGIGLSLYFGQSPFLGASLFSIIMALFLGALSSEKKERSDSLIGVIMAVSMAIGIIFINLTPGYKSEPMTYLFGNILTVAKSDIIYSIIFALICLLYISVYYRKILLVSYDPSYALSKAINVKLHNMIFFLAIAITVLFVIKIAGLIMLIALISIPAYIMEKYSKNLKKMIINSIIFTLFISIIGFLLSLKLNISSGGAIVIIGGIFFLLDKIKFTICKRV